jgi:putative membrane protein
MSLLITWVANSLAIYFVAYLMESVDVASWGVAFVAGAVLTLVNLIVKPVLVILTLPLTIVTLGLFYFVVTAICLWLAAALVPGFMLRGILAPIIAAILVGLTSAIVNSLLTRATK